MAEAALGLREGRWAPAVSGQRRLRIGRVLLYAVLSLFALYYLAPLYVMVATSLKSAEELREARGLADRDAEGAKVLIGSLLEPTANAPSDALLAAALLSSTSSGLARVPASSPRLPTPRLRASPS